MNKRRKKNDFIWLYMADDGTEELRLRKEEALKKIEAYKKSKEDLKIAENKEAFHDNDFQKQVISMLSQLLEKQSELEKNINRIFR
ncbi:MAG: hypothetical protein ABS917_03500 [Solibacillus sp.]|uniref:hypothetical protein n=1 Tax=Solibacillus sp. TaxID=1909654 RepID=UPI003314E70E